MRRVFAKVLICLCLVVIIPKPVYSEGDPPQVPIDDEFIDTLVLIMTNQDILQGNLEQSSLAGLREYVDEYYFKKMIDVRNANNTYDASIYRENPPDFTQDDDPAIQALVAKKNATLDKIDARINDPLLWVVKLFDLFTESDELDQQTSPVMKIVTGNDNPPTDYFDTMHSHIMTDFGTQVYILFNIDTQKTLPIAVADDTVALGQVNDTLPDSITNPPLDTENDPGLSLGNPTVGNPNSSTTSTNSALTTQIISFKNNGFESVMVKVESYLPPEGSSVPKPNASTVVASTSSSSASLEVPIGEYVFCYQWDLGQDLDGDGQTEYHHRTTSSISVTESATSLVVTLNPDSNVSNPNGRCGESSIPTSASQATNLTPEEQANSGTFYYRTSCQGLVFGYSCNDDESVTNHIAVQFDDSGVILTDLSTESQTLYYPRVGVNQFSGTVDGVQYIIVFTLDGFHYTFIDAPSDVNATLIFQRQ